MGRQALHPLFILAAVVFFLAAAPAGAQTIDELKAYKERTSHHHHETAPSPGDSGKVTDDDATLSQVYKTHGHGEEEEECDVCGEYFAEPWRFNEVLPLLWKKTLWPLLFAGLCYLYLSFPALKRAFKKKKEHPQ
ncbi:MAG: hypothetical protein RDV48_11505 [Candidatus Eremiobacteraeota bacterium]|nr:hypothetical protein [Candidatus Eremiobacteraeota bacterium]